MLYRNLVALLLAVLAFAPGCRSSAPQEPITVTKTVVRKVPTTAAVIPLSAPTAGEITVEQLALLLPRHPIVVGFDVDPAKTAKLAELGGKAATSISDLAQRCDPIVLAVFIQQRADRG